VPRHPFSTAHPNSNENEHELDVGHEKEHELELDVEHEKQHEHKLGS